MKLIIDNHVASAFAAQSLYADKEGLIANKENKIVFRWPALLTFLDRGSVFGELPSFEESQPLFQACVKTLFASAEKEVLFYVFDRLFAEILQQVAALPTINASTLSAAIEERQKKLYDERETALTYSLNFYQLSFSQAAPRVMHDLVLYLAWDRMCVAVSRLFDYQTDSPVFVHGLTVLKDCLLESYQHIKQQGRTSPSLYRLLEAFFYYQMREENLQKHTEEEWAVLSAGIPTLKIENEPADFFYIDDAMGESGAEVYLTLEPSEKVHTRLVLMKCLLNKLKTEDPHGAYQLPEKNIVFLNG